MRGLRVILLGLILAAAPGGAQTSPVDPLQFVPPELAALSQSSAFHTDLTFDRRMLALAGGIWEGGDPAVTQAIDKLNGLAIHNYHYAQPGMYDPRLVDGVRAAYRSLGWEHMVMKPGAHPTNAPGSGAVPAPDPNRAAIDGSVIEHGSTELWVRLEHLQVTGAVVLFTNPTNVALIAISGNLSPLDLLHLRGHFGIPRFSGDEFTPQP